MSDVAYRPNDNAAPEAPPAETVQLESKEVWRAEAIKQGVPLDQDRPLRPDEVAELANEGKDARDDVLAKEMSRDLNRQRERDGHISDLPPLVEIKAPRGKDSYRDVRELTSDMTFNRRLSRMNQALDAGADTQTAEAIAMKDGQFEPTPVSLVKDNGEIIPELGRSLTGEDEIFRNAYEATRALRNGRAVVEAQLQADLAEYQRPSVEQQRQTNPEPPPVSSPVEVPQQTQEQINALAAERFRVAQRAAALQLTAEERGLVAKNQQWDRWLDSVPEARSWEAWEATRTNHPQRFAQVVKGFEQCRNAKAAIARRAGELGEIRQNRSNQWRAHQEAALTARNDAWDKQAYQYLQTLPEFRADKAAFRRAVKDHLLSTGMTEQQIDHEWHYGDKLRTPEAQITIAQAARLRMMQERASPERLAARRRNNAPQPQAPGNWMPRGADHAEDIGRLERQLEQQGGTRAALFTAAKLTKLKRQAGQL